MGGEAQDDAEHDDECHGQSDYGSQAAGQGREGLRHGRIVGHGASGDPVPPGYRSVASKAV